MEKNKDTMIDDDFLAVLDSIITKGKLEKEITITPELKLTMRILDTWETITAESISPLKVDEASLDLVFKTRGLNKIIRAIVAVNGIPVEDEKLTPELSRARRVALYSKVGALPTSLIDKIQQGYIDLCLEQEKLFRDVDKNSENF